jgi:hypothetical protein
MKRLAHGTVVVIRNSLSHATHVRAARVPLEYVCWLRCVTRDDSSFVEIQIQIRIQHMYSALCVLEKPGKGFAARARGLAPPTSTHDAGANEESNPWNSVATPKLVLARLRLDSPHSESVVGLGCAAECFLYVVAEALPAPTSEATCALPGSIRRFGGPLPGRNEGAIPFKCERKRGCIRISI